MPTAVTHVITSIVLVDLFRKYALKKKQLKIGTNSRNIWIDYLTSLLGFKLED